ncbi:MAG: gliding motility-associated C-terminal domain-containing protein [Ekhidna sp.]|uniref:T9SS type B sorting domain-containing protein n=1 Tax=Ekhidna sp. TaxID=2608089 RepID=UPI0032ECDE1C
MKKLIYIFCFLPFALSAQLYIPANAIVHISEDANLEVGGDLQNYGVIQNTGTLSLYGDWIINNNFNGLTGRLQFIGDEDQMISPPQLTVGELIINQGGQVNFTGGEYTVINRLDFQFGVIKPGENTRFIMGPDAKVMGGSNLSYFDGSIIARGGGTKTFPVGSDGLYSPITLLDVDGANTEIAARFYRGNDVDPIPGDSLLGVSHRSLWEVELISGTTGETQVEVEFSEEDLSDFRVRNNIRYRVSVPVIAYANNPAGEFMGLGAGTITNSDSLTYGTLTSKFGFQPTLGLKAYFSLARAPQIPNQGLYFIPEAFSPQARDSRNQTFRIFGENISSEDFDLQIYNRYGSVVYSTNSFEEANKTGWNGENQRTGAEEPAGVYYYTIRFRFDSGLPIEKKGAFYLVK